MTWPAVMRGTAAEVLALQHQFNETQWWAPDRLRMHQFQQLQRLLEHAARTVPFYAERFRAAGIDPNEPLTDETWARLPLLTRQEVQHGGQALHSTAVPRDYGGIAEVATGGSTGVPVRVRKTALDGLMWNAAQIREEFWHRENPAGSIVRIRSLPRHFTSEMAEKVRSPEGLTLPNRGSPSRLLWETGPITLIDYMLPTPQQVALLRRLSPDYLYTTPATLRLLLAHCRDTGTTLPSLRAVWTISEVVDRTLRALCQEVLGVRIVHNYSAGEIGYIALQCPDHAHFHVVAESVMVEVVDGDGRTCAPGEIGRVVITPLHNFAMPLLRYEIGDEAEVGAPCPCGRGLPVLSQVVGRTVDHLTLPAGGKRRTDFNHYRLSRITAIQEYQVVQRSLDRIEVLLVLGRALTTAEEQEVRAVFDAEFAPDFRVELTVCDAIPRTAGGKLRTFVSELPGE